MGMESQNIVWVSDEHVAESPRLGGVVASQGFVKLALRSGAEIVPVYFFGNTSVLSVLSTTALRRRRIGIWI